MFDTNMIIEAKNKLKSIGLLFITLLVCVGWAEAHPPSGRLLSNLRRF
jgi:hypothetical protein